MVEALPSILLIISPIQLSAQALTTLSFWQSLLVCPARGNVGMALLYRPPSSPVSYFDNLSTALENLCIPLFSNFMLIGDCNVDISIPTALCCQLLDMTNQYGLTAIRTGHTRVTDSSMTTIDLAFTTSPTSNKSCDTIPPLCSYI